MEIRIKEAEPYRPAWSIQTEQFDSTSFMTSCRNRANQTSRMIKYLFRKINFLKKMKAVHNSLLKHLSDEFGSIEIVKIYSSLQLEVVCSREQFRRGSLETIRVFFSLKICLVY